MVGCVQAHGATAQRLLVAQRGGSPARECDFDDAVVALPEGL